MLLVPGLAIRAAYLAHQLHTFHSCLLVVTRLQCSFMRRSILVWPSSYLLSTYGADMILDIVAWGCGCLDRNELWAV